MSNFYVHCTAIKTRKEYTVSFYLSAKDGKMKRAIKIYSYVREGREMRSWQWSHQRRGWLAIISLASETSTDDTLNIETRLQNMLLLS